MNQPSLFHEEEETVRIAEELLDSQDQPNISWNSQYRNLFDKYKMLLSRFRGVMDVGDAMRNELNGLNEKLRESETRYHRMFEKNPAIKLLINARNGRIVDANPAATEFYGYEREKLKQLKISDINILSPEQLCERVEDVKSGNPGHYLFQHRLASGELRDVEVYAGAVDVDGRRLVHSIVHDITDRRKTEEALRRSEEKYRRVFENIQDVYLECLVEGTVVEVSPSVEGLLGFSGDELIGGPVLRIYPFPEQREALLAKLTKDQVVQDHELTLRRKDGTVTLCSTHSRLIYNESDNTYRICGVLRDITERKRTEALLETSLQRFYTIISSLPDGMLLVTDEGRVEFANQAFCDLFDLHERPAELQGLNSPDMIRKIRDVYANPADVINRIREIVARETPVIGEEVAIRGGRTYLGDFIPIIINGERYGRLWRHLDITERKKMEEDLRRSEEMYRRIFENIEDVYFEADLRFTILQVSPSVERVLGYRREEVIGFAGLPFLGVHGREECLLSKLTADRVVRDYESPVLFKDGTLRVCSVNARLVYDESGNPARICGVLRDITERKKAEDQIRASLREKEVLLREVHHRVKNNFQMIAGLLALQSDQIADKLRPEALKEAEARVLAMARVHEKLYQSRHLGEIRMDEYLIELARELIGFHGQKDAKIVFKGNIEPLAFDIDSAIQCGLITTELVTNALKHAFLNRKEGAVEINLQTVPEGGYELTVSDDGVGLPENITVDNADSLGLRLVQAFAKRCRGAIVIERSHGTTIRIRFK